MIHFQKVVRAMWAGGKLKTPLLHVDIDQENMFGRIDWQAIRKAVIEALPRRAASTAVKHTASTKVQRTAAEPFEANRGTGQGDVDAPIEACLVQGTVARNARKEVLQGLVTAGNTNADMTAWLEAVERWEGTDTEVKNVRREDGSRATHPGDAIPTGSLMLDGWYLDDGRIWMHPALARNFLSCFDRCTAATGGRRNRGKTKIVFYMPQDEAQRHAQEWHLRELEELGEVSYLPEQVTTLGAETG